jgi:uncharacterized membrane protein YqhA
MTATNYFAFVPGDIIDLRSFVALLKHPPEYDKVSHFLRQHLSAETRSLISGYDGGLHSELERALLEDLNRIIRSGLIYDADRFAHARLSASTIELLQPTPHGPELYHLNRLLIQESYPAGILRQSRRHSVVEEFFESALYNCRFFVLLAVLGSLAASFVLFLKGTEEIVQGVRSFVNIPSPFSPSAADNRLIILAFIPAVDNYLFATVLLIFSMGSYELFISKIDPSWRGPSSRPNWLNINGLDDLKTHVGEVVIMILIINFFELAFSLSMDRPLDLLMLGGGILLVALSLYVTHRIIAHRGKRGNQGDHARHGQERQSGVA